MLASPGVDTQQKDYLSFSCLLVGHGSVGSNKALDVELKNICEIDYAFQRV